MCQVEECTEDLNTILPQPRNNKESQMQQNQHENTAAATRYLKLGSIPHSKRCKQMKVIFHCLIG